MKAESLMKNTYEAKPKISIIIPVFNVEKHLEACLGSVMRQTYENIEIICVNDASTDNSLKICEALAAQDTRIRVINFYENSSANQARKTGVLTSTGDVIMFLDGDDELLPIACDTVAKSMTLEQPDVLHFGARVINKSGVPDSRIQWNQKKIAPYLDDITGDLIEACFEKNRFFFTLWNKAFKGSLARKAFSYIKDGKFPRAQDLYATFILLYFSKTYKGISNILLNYNFGNGITGRNRYDLTSFKRFCEASKVAEAINDFVDLEKKYKEYGSIVNRIRKDLLNDTLTQWMSHLEPKDKAAGFNLLTQYWGVEEIVSLMYDKNLSEKNKFSLERIASAISGSEALCCQVKSNLHIKTDKTIGIFYHRYYGGGVQRVISLLIPLFSRLGWKIVLITEEHEPDKEFPLPDNISRAFIPPHKNGKDFKTRAFALGDILRKLNIDVLNYHASSYKDCLFDLIVTKLLGCKFIFTRHELAFSSFLNNSDNLVWHQAVYSLADKITVLSRMDEQYYNIMGVPAVFIPNPKPNLKCLPSNVSVTSQIVLWVGRFDFIQKQCQEPLEIMSEIVRIMPHTKLVMLGDNWSQDARERLRNRINDLGLQNNIELHGYTPYPEKYYSNATCLLVTSAWESYGMVIEESRAFSLPVVMYEMPYLELLQSGKGFIAVKQLDRPAAANAIIQLLKNKELREQLGRDAQAELIARTDALAEQRWKETLNFETQASQSVATLDQKYLRLLMENALFLYSRGLSRQSSKKALIDDKNEKLNLARCLIDQTSLHTQPIHKNNPENINLKSLIDRKNKTGNIGAIDFLIQREIRKM